MNAPSRRRCLMSAGHQHEPYRGKSCSTSAFAAAHQQDTVGPNPKSAPGSYSCSIISGRLDGCSLACVVDAGCSLDRDRELALGAEHPSVRGQRASSVGKSGARRGRHQARSGLRAASKASLVRRHR
jgi:hypothetical protein